MSKLVSSRREMIKWGIAAPSLAGVSGAAFANVADGYASDGHLALDAMLVDTRFNAQAAKVQSGIKQMHFSGDVTRIWYDELDAKWRERGFVLGGITGSDALFVLENLAQQQGRRVVHRQQLAAKDERGIAPVSWVIAPYHKSVLS